jgi:hypothetical protein
MTAELQIRQDEVFRPCDASSPTPFFAGGTTKQSGIQYNLRLTASCLARTGTGTARHPYFSIRRPEPSTRVDAFSGKTNADIKNFHTEIKKIIMKINNMPVQKNNNSYDISYFHSGKIYIDNGFFCLDTVKININTVFFCFCTVI